MKVIITGGCGFIGSHIVQHIFKNTDWNIIIIDKLNYASKGFTRIKELNFFGNPRCQIFTYDLSVPMGIWLKREIGYDIDYILHLAAETHVDNSIKDPELFIKNNIMSTFYMLEYAREINGLKKFIYFSTDEVYGVAQKDILYKEWDRHKPGNPYSASKSASEMICLSYENTYKIPLTIVNVMNVIGQRQHVEKFIPLAIRKILAGDVISIHCNKTCTKAGARYYIHARNVADAVMFIINNGVVGEKYNIVGEREIDNLEMAKFISTVIGKDLKYEMVDFHSNRPGHDLRYALDGQKLYDLGWRPPVNFTTSLEKTIKWYLENPRWLED